MNFVLVCLIQPNETFLSNSTQGNSDVISMLAGFCDRIVAIDSVTSPPYV